MQVIFETQAKAYVVFCFPAARNLVYLDYHIYVVNSNAIRTYHIAKSSLSEFVQLKQNAVNRVLNSYFNEMRF